MFYKYLKSYNRNSKRKGHEGLLKIKKIIINVSKDFT